MIQDLPRSGRRIWILLQIHEKSLLAFEEVLVAVREIKRIAASLRGHFEFRDLFRADVLVKIIAGLDLWVEREFPDRQGRCLGFRD